MSKILVVSDIHANATALEAVIKDAGSITATWCLGDLVGYGPDPNECVELIRSLPNLQCLLGNHDAAALGKIDLKSFNHEAGISAIWTRENLKVSNIKYLESLPEKLYASENVTIAHGSPRNPVWEYLLDVFSAWENFKYFETQLCFVGHTHIPLVYSDSGKPFAEWKRLIAGNTVFLNQKAILNPGSVGQPRDHDPRSAYALYDPEKGSWESRRIEYDIASVQERILKAGLPRRHAERLNQGW